MENKFDLFQECSSFYLKNGFKFLYPNEQE